MSTSEYFESPTMDVQNEENVLVQSEPSNLSNINNDCKELIFEHLEWLDLLNLADTNKQLNVAVCRVFKRKYSSAKICLGIKLHRYGFSISL